MPDIEIVIKMSEEEYGKIKENDMGFYNGRFFQMVRNGTVLPKGHGRLKDVDAFIDFLKNISKTQKYNEFIIDKELTGLTIDDVFNAVCESLQNEGLAEGNSPTIIPADKEKKDADSD